MESICCIHGLSPADAGSLLQRLRRRCLYVPSEWLDPSARTRPHIATCPKEREQPPRKPLDCAFVLLHAPLVVRPRSSLFPRVQLASCWCSSCPCVVPLPSAVNTQCPPECLQRCYRRF